MGAMSNAQRRCETTTLTRHLHLKLCLLENKGVRFFFLKQGIKIKCSNVIDSLWKGRRVGGGWGCEMSLFRKRTITVWGKKQADFDSDIFAPC